MMRIGVKILGHKTPQRYAVRRAVLAAQTALSQEYPDLLVEITEVRERSEIEKVTQVIIYPSLVVNDRLVCVGRFPSKDEIIIWFHQALQ
ncbi:MAG: thioredoxin family protein [Chloroflexi bacterium]|nr:thioredoxin family protein [Chloroflexota bacterium]